MAKVSGDQKLTDYVTLVSCDGFEFQVLRSAACVSGLIKRMLDPVSMSRQNSADASELTRLRQLC